MEVSGKTALVTGGTDGIGIEIARHLKAKGARVIVAARREDLLEAARGEGFEAIRADLSSAMGCAALVETLGTRPLDILINNAGMGGGFEPGDPIDLALVDRAVFLNLNAPMHLIGLLLDRLKARPEAAIVNVTSGLAIAPRSGGPVYCATKAGLRSFTMALRAQLKGSGVHVIEALPPVVDTAMTAANPRAKMPAAQCARQIVAAIESDRDEADVGQVRWLKLAYSLSPAIARKIMLKF